MNNVEYITTIVVTKKPTLFLKTSWSPEWDKMRSLLAAQICHFYLLIARNPDFCDKKCRILTYCDKRPLIYSQCP